MADTGSHYNGHCEKRKPVFTARGDEKETEDGPNKVSVEIGKTL